MQMFLMKWGGILVPDYTWRECTWTGSGESGQ